MTPQSVPSKSHTPMKFIDLPEPLVPHLCSDLQVTTVGPLLTWNDLKSHQPLCIMRLCMCVSTQNTPAEERGGAVVCLAG